MIYLYLIKIMIIFIKFIMKFLNEIGLFFKEQIAI